MAVVSLAAGASFGAAPVARVIGAQPVEVDGISMPQGNYTPVSTGSSVHTKAGVAVLQFRDGSNVALQPNATVKIEGDLTAPQVRVVQGTATYTIALKSHLRIVNSRGEMLNQILNKALPEAAAITHSVTPIEPALAYRAGSRLPGGVAPTTAITFGGFSGAVFHADGFGSGTITTPSGLKLTLTQNANGTFTVSSITQIVTKPDGTTAQITTTAAENPNNPLFGATVGGVTDSTPNGTEVSLTFTTAGGAPLTPTQVSTAVTTATTTAVNTAVNAGTLPPGTQPPAPTPVSTGQFSSSAS